MEFQSNGQQKKYKRLPDGLYNASGSHELGSRYKFGGKEVVSGVYDFGARYYYPAIGRFMSVDPLAEDYAGLSPYNYTLNNPVRFIDPDGMAPDNIGIDKAGNVVFDDGINDGNLYVVNDGVKVIKDLAHLLLNSTQLSKNHVWVGSEEQLVDYIKSQWNQADNGLKSLVHVLNIKVENGLQNRFAVNLYSGKKDDSGGVKINVKPLKEQTLLIGYQKGKESHHLSNPYNTRNALEHEKEHIKQSVRHYHQKKGWITNDRAARELEAIKSQKMMPSWNKTTPEYREAVKSYENLWHD